LKTPVDDIFKIGYLLRHASLLRYIIEGTISAKRPSGRPVRKH